MPYSRSTTISARRKSAPFSSRRVGLAFLLVTSIAVATMLLTDWMGGQGYFALKEVTIVGNQFIRDAEIEDLTKLTAVQNVLYVDTEAIENLLTSHPLIKEAHVKRQPANVRGRLHDVAHEIDVVIVVAALHDRGGALQPHAGVD